MFKSAATKIAHNSTIPVFAGNQELRPLQDLITAEKAVLISLQKLSVDFSKASEALRTWGLSEGDDLGDILGASASALNHFSTALSQYATHGNSMRELLKTIRTREENLDEMKRRRRTVFRKADDADKKLSKMSPEHKSLQMQTDLLNRLRDEIGSLDTDIMVEEAALGDFKRTATKMFMGLKFGGLLEGCRKGSIAADYGQMIISEISEEKTQPGLHRAFYQGHAKTENLVAECQHAVNDVTLSTVPTLSFRDRRQYYNGREGPGPSVATVQNDKPMPSVPRRSSDFPGFTPPPRMFASDVPPSPRSFSQRQNSMPWSENQGIEPVASTSTQKPWSEHQGIEPAASTSTQKPWSEHQDIESAASTSTQKPWSENQSVEPAASTLTQKRSGSIDDFGMNFVRPHTGPMDNNAGPSGRFATFPVKARPAAVTHSPTYSLDPLPLQSRHDLGPSFASSVADALDHKDSLDPFADDKNVSNSALPALSSSSITPSASINPWVDATEEISKPEFRKSNLSDNDDALLAYLISGDEEVNGSAPQQSLQVPEKYILSEVQTRVGEEEPKEVSIPEPPSNRIPVEVEVSRLSGSSSFGNRPVSGIGREDRSSKVYDRPSSFSPNSETQSNSTSHGSDEQEKMLNAVAAREIRLELEALNTNSSMTHFPDSAERGRPRAGTGQSYNSSEGVGRDHSPLAPPSAPFARRSVSPHPYPEMNLFTSPGAAGHSYGSPHGSGGPSSVLFSKPHESQHPARSRGSPVQPYSPSRLQTGSTPLSAAPIIEHQLLPKGSSSSNLSGGAPGTRTIAAAAFRKPRNKSVDNLPGAKGLPGSPYPTQGVGGGPRNFSASSYLPSSEDRLSQGGSEYDYIDAYLQPNSPHKSEFTGDSVLPRADGGYQTGKFSTDLEEDALR